MKAGTHECTFTMNPLALVVIHSLTVHQPVHCGAVSVLRPVNTLTTATLQDSRAPKEHIEYLTAKCSRLDHCVVQVARCVWALARRMCLLYGDRRETKCCRGLCESCCEDGAGSPLVFLTWGAAEQGPGAEQSRCPSREAVPAIAPSSLSLTLLTLLLGLSVSQSKAEREKL
ncbi:hypothetical protein TREES_T100003872 [Tupaia chinensis]|uniref:Uncharacterized protein n=1 Tax=Tupaia chinensis TaxID=246437 RepID=L9KYW9_TUPCH|nr:hypothetical protein TREES_T100003872 [Tupaia chinensis]